MLEDFRQKKYELDFGKVNRYVKFSNYMRKEMHFI